MPTPERPNPDANPNPSPDHTPDPRPSHTQGELHRIGLVVHPTRDVDQPLAAMREWAEAHGAELGQIPFGGEPRELAEPTPAADCDLVVAIGGDGTTLAAIRTAAPCDRPVLGVACGSLGALTTVEADDLADALERYASGDWTPRELPALQVSASSSDREQAGADAPPESSESQPASERATAFNDIVVTRRGEGQVRIAAYVDEQLFARLAGDGCIVSTAVGSSAYTLAAGGPLLPPGIDAFVMTPLPTHGGFRPPLVLQAGSVLTLHTSAGHGGAKLEIDGQLSELPTQTITLRLRPGAATLVRFADAEPLLAGLRRRGIITDSPRILADDARAAEKERR